MTQAKRNDFRDHVFCTENMLVLSVGHAIDYTKYTPLKQVIVIPDSEIRPSSSSQSKIIRL